MCAMCRIVRDMSTQPTGAGWIGDDSAFGARLALVRQRMGWGNVAEAALACGLPVGSWRNWERDGRKPRDYVAVCRAIADRTGCDLGWLIGLPDQGREATPPPQTEPSGLLRFHRADVERLLGVEAPATVEVEAPIAEDATASP